MNVMRLTNLFLIGLKTRSVRENAFHVLKIWPRKGFTNPRAEFINIILLNDHIIKLKIYLYTHRSVQLSDFPKKFFAQWMVVNTEAQS